MEGRTDEDILSAAGRLRASRRRRGVKACAVCGTPFEGIARKRYCSDACRVRAARSRAAARHEAPSGGREAWRRGGESGGTGMGATTSDIVRNAGGRVEVGDLDVAAVVAGARAAGADPIRALLRARGYLEHEVLPLAPAPRDQNESVVAYFDRVRGAMTRGRRFVGDSADLLREARDERTAQLERAIRGERADEE